MLSGALVDQGPQSPGHSGHSDHPGAAPLLALVGELAARSYRFITPTPLTHQRVAKRASRQTGRTPRDIFGWNLPFSEDALDETLLKLMRNAGVLLNAGDGLSRASVRVSSIGDDLFLHSAYPTHQDDAVFFGPDTYRFARFIAQGVTDIAEAQNRPSTGHEPPLGQVLRLLDVGCGSGAGGIVAARCLARFGARAQVSMNDINPLALSFTAINAAAAGVQVQLALGDALAAVAGEFDLVVSNPPYLDDPAGRAYRHGGGGLGRQLSVRIAREALARLAPGGSLLLYTGVAIVDGLDPFIAELQPLLEQMACTWSYSEIDPDVFGEELELPVYAEADRIAAVGLVVTRTGAR